MLNPRSIAICLLLAVSLVAIAGCSSGSVAPSTSIPNQIIRPQSLNQSAPMATMAALVRTQLRKFLSDLGRHRFSANRKFYRPRLTRHHTMILADGKEVALPPGFKERATSSVSTNPSSVIVPNASPTCTPQWVGNTPPSCDSNGPFRSVYSAPGLTGVGATIIGSNFSNPSGDADSGYIYFEGWPGPNQQSSEVGIFLSDGAYFFYTSTPSTGMEVTETPSFPVGDTMLLLLGGGTCSTGTGTCLAAILEDLTCGNLPQCEILADVPATGWVESCCIIARMSAIAQESNDFTNSDDFGPSVWSSVVQGVGSEGGNPDDPPFVPAGYQDWPNDTTRIVVDFTDADDETDTIDLLPTLDIYDNNLQKTVTKATPSAAVGQQQSLKAVDSQAGATLSNCGWTIAGNNVGAYTPGTAPAPVPTSSPQVGFFWTGSGTNTANATDKVSVACTDQAGHKLTASTTYTVKQPTEKMTTKTGNVEIGPYPQPTGTPLALSFGERSLSNYGIHWIFTARTPSTVSGTLGVAQVVNTTQTATPAGCWATVNGNGLLDSRFPLANDTTPISAGTSVTWSSQNPNAAYDNPAIGLGNPCTEESRNDNFTDYLMFQPSSDNVGNSIWITLGTLNWAWAGDAQLDPTSCPVALVSNWCLATHSNTVNPSGVPSAVLPTWTGAY